MKKTRGGGLRAADALVTTGYRAQAVALNTHILQGLKRAAEAIDRFDKEQRNLSAVTLGVSAEGFAAIQEEAREFRRRVMQIAARDSADRVYQLSVQLYPASRPVRRNRKES